MRLGFTCAWDPQPEPTWSYTPWNLRRALRDFPDTADLDCVDAGVRFPDPVRLGLKALNARRVDGTWVSMWKHSRLARRYLDTAVRHDVAASGADVVLQVQDLAVVDRPYLVLQDLSYDVLFEHRDERGRLTHFPSLDEADLIRLRDRQRGVYAEAAGVLAMSRWFAEHLVRVSGVDPAKVHVVNPGASATWAGAAVPEEVLRRRREGPRTRLLLVGKDFATKSGPQVVAALAQLRAEVDPDFTLTVVGPREWPMVGEPPPGVTFLGRLPVERLAQVYDEHDLFVMPSKFEGFGIALVEALSRGLPCVARNAFAMPEIVVTGRNGDLVDSDDPAELASTIARLRADDAIFDRVAREMADVRAHHSWARAAAQVADIARGVTKS
ncbi:Glycosyltransferase [Actinokineospora spheciospongiae]|uniref:Glycosyltransferase n=1 Tax=Actinokineospora spheciospongiae TaxID=909613 RepID=W7IE70_9PSEU|nr:glycosyltransferase family 4 protein [Actinokineospora spheciospongiae]EWC59130.1 Glycosyltransferase [Actinokineospora spheciospongiae]